jgi:hypothetical protein
VLEEKVKRNADVHNPDGEIGIVPEKVAGATVVGEDGEFDESRGAGTGLLVCAFQETVDRLQYTKSQDAD